jgi:hypothetical protein
MAPELTIPCSSVWHVQAQFIFPILEAKTSVARY